MVTLRLNTSERRLFSMLKSGWLRKCAESKMLRPAITATIINTDINADLMISSLTGKVFSHSCMVFHIILFPFPS